LTGSTGQGEEEEEIYMVANVVFTATLGLRAKTVDSPISDTPYAKSAILP
jgi:hypothetical protein